MPPAPLPTPNVGDKYYFANGWREQVINTNGETYDLINKKKTQGGEFPKFCNSVPLRRRQNGGIFQGIPCGHQRLMAILRWKIHQIHHRRAVRQQTIGSNRNVFSILVM
jgi:hypothetical protein